MTSRRADDASPGPPRQPVVADARRALGHSPPDARRRRALGQRLASGRRRRRARAGDLELIPYGKDNWRRNADTRRGEWFAARGYALVRIDVRGTGSSGGVALDEYSEAETEDGVEAVAWLAAQRWCTGAVGMWGISYGAFTAIQVAKRRPPALKAIVPFQGTDDRYRNGRPISSAGASPRASSRNTRSARSP